MNFNTNLLEFQQSEVPDEAKKPEVFQPSDGLGLRVSFFFGLG